MHRQRKIGLPARGEPAYVRAGGKLAADAFRLLELHSRPVATASLVADTLKEPVTLAAIQNAVLECLTGDVALVDTAGVRNGACVHEELPKMLQFDGLAPQTVENGGQALQSALTQTSSVARDKPRAGS